MLIPDLLDFEPAKLADYGGVISTVRKPVAAIFLIHFEHYLFTTWVKAAEVLVKDALSPLCVAVME
jgi:hypothetical protein